MLLKFVLSPCGLDKWHFGGIYEVTLLLDLVLGNKPLGTSYISDSLLLDISDSIHY